jgi:hypothetical protein
LEIVISGPSSEASAVSLLEQNLPSLVHFSAPSQSLP